MNERTEAFIRDKKTGQLVDAILIEDVLSESVVGAAKDWRAVIDKRINELMGKGVPKEQWPEHFHWDWVREYKRTGGLLAYKWFGIEYENQVQGLALASIEIGNTCRIDSQKGKPLVYVKYLATAPWNSPLFVERPRYGQVGTVLMAAMIQMSQEDEEFGGRIGLHSLTQSVEFYEKNCGMTNLGVDSLTKLPYLEMTPTQTTDFFQKYQSEYETKNH